MICFKFQAYKRAYDLSVLCFGKDAFPTRECYRRYSNPPRTREEIEQEYGGQVSEDEDD